MSEPMMKDEPKTVYLSSILPDISHEFNNPLAAILQNLQNIERRLFDDTPSNRDAASRAGFRLEELRSYLESREISDFIQRIREAGSRTATLVQKMQLLNTGEKSDR